jgi:hypothetical protein
MSCYYYSFIGAIATITVGLIIDQFINRSADRAMINPASVSPLANDSELYARAMETSLKQWRLVQEGQMGNAPPKQIVK